MRTRKPASLIAHFESLIDRPNIEQVVTLKSLEDEQCFLKYLYGWNCTLLPHALSLFGSNLEQDDPDFRRDIASKWQLPFREIQSCKEEEKE